MAVATQTPQVSAHSPIDNCANPVTMQLTAAEADVVAKIRNIGWGEVTVAVQRGEIVVAKEVRTTKY